MPNLAGVPTIEPGDSTSGWRRSIAEFTRGWRQFWQGYWQSAHSC